MCFHIAVNGGKRICIGAICRKNYFLFSCKIVNVKIDCYSPTFTCEKTLGDHIVNTDFQFIFVIAVYLFSTMVHVYELIIIQPC